MPPTVQSNGMGVGEYSNTNFYSKMTTNEKINNDELEENKKDEE